MKKMVIKDKNARFALATIAILALLVVVLTTIFYINRAVPNAKNNEISQRQNYERKREISMKKANLQPTITNRNEQITQNSPANKKEQISSSSDIAFWNRAKYRYNSVQNIDAHGGEYLIFMESQGGGGRGEIVAIDDSGKTKWKMKIPYQYNVDNQYLALDSYILASNKIISYSSEEIADFPYKPEKCVKFADNFICYSRNFTNKKATTTIRFFEKNKIIWQKEIEK